MQSDDRISVGRPIPRIAQAKAGPERFVEITWEDGSQQVIDLSPALLSHRGYVRLRTDDELFRTLEVGEYGSYLVWADGAELPASRISDLADSTLDNAQFRDAMDQLNMSLDGMAARLGVARRLIADYRKDKPIPKAVALATRYLLEMRKAG